MLFSNKKEPTTDVCNHKNIKNYVAQKKPDTKEYTLV